MSGEDVGETKPKLEAGGGEVISIKVKDQASGEVVFKVKNSTKFQKVFEAFCTRKAWDVNHVRFVFDGKRVNGEQTPQDLEMESDDVSAAAAAHPLRPLVQVAAVSPCSVDVALTPWFELPAFACRQSTQCWSK